MKQKYLTGAFADRNVKLVLCVLYELHTKLLAYLQNDCKVDFIAINVNYRLTRWLIKDDPIINTSY